MPRKPRMDLTGGPCHVIQRGNYRINNSSQFPPAITKYIIISLSFFIKYPVNTDLNNLIRVNNVQNKTKSHSCSTVDVSVFTSQSRCYNTIQ